MNSKSDNPTITKIKDLPIEERLLLVEELWDSIAADAGQLPLTDAQRLELDRRLAAYEQNQDEGRPAKEVLQKIGNLL